jgi:2-oxoglutarate dehydrogenase E2 component (dihydrolipoamide succinyltransferase)
LLAEIETDKIAVEIRAPFAGILSKRFAKTGDNVRVGSDLYQLTPSVGVAKSAAAAAAAAPAAAASAKPAPAAATAAPAAPAAAAAAAPAAAPAKAAPAAAPAAPVAVHTGERTDRRVKMKKMRVRTAERLKDSQNTYAMLTTFNEVDMTELLALRQEYKDAFEKKHGVKLGFMSAFIKASAEALVASPLVNAVIDGDDIVYRDYVDISVAVASPNGLVVPVLRNVERMSLADIERGVAQLADKARDNKLTVEDSVGGTFTISNGGVFGSMMGTPIINPPQSAILGMHATKPRPVARNGVVEIRPIMYVALTYDHRIIDGREAVTFLVNVKNLIEDPRRMLLGL